MPELHRPARGDERTGDSATAETTPHFLDHRVRLRKRFLDAGAAALADYEMLELVLFRAIPRRDVKPLAKTLLARFGSFAEVISAPRERLKEVTGLGDAAVAEFKIIEAAASRLARGQVKARHVLSSWSSVLGTIPCSAHRTFSARGRRVSSACSKRATGSIRIGCSLR